MRTARILPLVATSLLFASVTSSVTQPASAAGSQCTRGWTGTVTYGRQQSSNSSKTQDRVSGRGTESSNFSLSSHYSAQIAVRDVRDPSAVNGLASISMNSNSSETRSAQDSYTCPHEKGRRTMTGTFVDKGARAESKPT